jgi:hypothetical protein
LPGSCSNSHLLCFSHHKVAQLKENNIVQDPLPAGTHASFADIIASFPPPSVSSAPPSRSTGGVLTPAETILPQYLGSDKGPQSGRRTHGTKPFTG